MTKIATVGSNKEVNTTTKKIVNLTTKENKEKFINEKKELIKNSDSNKEVDFFKNLDFINVSENIKNLSEKSLSKDRELMYKYPNEIRGNKDKEKAFRTKLRKDLKKFVETFLYNIYIQKNEINAKNTFNLFNVFYKDNYLKNDFSLLSLSANNRDKDNNEKNLIMFLDTIKKLELI
jgi:hypothetical protein